MTSTEPEPIDIDELMNRSVVELSSIDIDAIIEWHREQRRRRAAGRLGHHRYFPVDWPVDIFLGPCWFVARRRAQ